MASTFKLRLHWQKDASSLRWTARCGAFRLVVNCVFDSAPYRIGVSDTSAVVARARTPAGAMLEAEGLLVAMLGAAAGNLGMRVVERETGGGAGAARDQAADAPKGVERERPGGRSRGPRRAAAARKGP